MNENTGTELSTTEDCFFSLPRIDFFPPYSFCWKQWGFAVPPQRLKTFERGVRGAGPFRRR